MFYLSQKRLLRKYLNRARIEKRMPEKAKVTLINPAPFPFLPLQHNTTLSPQRRRLCHLRRLRHAYFQWHLNNNKTKKNNTPARGSKSRHGNKSGQRLILAASQLGLFIFQATPEEPPGASPAAASASAPA